MTPDVSKLFAQFAGQEIPLVETPVERVFLGKTHRMTETRMADENHPTLVALDNTAKAHGLRLRLVWPGAAVTRDMRTDRVNAYLAKEADGKWRLQNNFHIG